MTDGSDRRRHRADGRDRAAADAPSSRAIEAVGVGAGDGAAAVRPGWRRAGRRSPTGAATSSTAARWRRSSTAPTSPSTSPSRSSAAARRPAGSTSRAAATSSKPRSQAGVRAARLRLLGRRLRLPPREPAAADRGASRLAAATASTTRPRRPSWRRRWTSSLAGTEVDAYVFRPCIVAGPRATMLIEQVVGSARLGDPLPSLRRRWAGCRCRLARSCPTSASRSSSSTTTTSPAALAAAIAGEGEPGAYNLAGDGDDRRSATSPARSAGARSACRGPSASLGGTVGAAPQLRLSPQLEWAVALRPAGADGRRKARRELGWEPRFDAAETLIQTASAPAKAAARLAPPMFA